MLPPTPQPRRHSQRMSGPSAQTRKRWPSTLQRRVTCAVPMAAGLTAALVQPPPWRRLAAFLELHADTDERLF